MRRSFVPVLTSALLCFALAGCKVTQEDIDEWTGTQKGPGKIVAVLLADKYEDDLRSYAGLALVRMEPRAATSNHDPIDGVVELQAAVRQLEPETRTRLVASIASGLMEMMQGGTTAPADDGQVAPPLQIRAKDAAFLLLPYAGDDTRQTLTEAIVDWFVVDFNARNLAGNYTAEQVVRQLGAPAASRLVDAMNARTPQQALVKLAELIGALGDSDTKTRAAARLVAIEQEMESDEEFYGWLQERLRAQLRASQPDGEIDENRVNAAAALNRENYILLGALPAMRHLNDARVVQDRLLAVAMEEGTSEPMLQRRKTALLALEGAARQDQATALLDLALINDPPPRQNQAFDQLRDAAFDRLTDTRSTAVLPRLWTAYDAATDWVFRYRIGTVILSLGGAAVVQQFFQHLQAEAYAQEELYNYGQRLAALSPPPTDFINAQLQSEQWFDRVIALYFWERRAQEGDVARITALEGDEAATQGDHWEDQNTVGKVAEAVAGAVRERLRRGSSDGAAQGEAQGDTEQGSGE